MADERARTCRLAGCEKGHVSPKDGLCSFHHYRQEEHGRPYSEVPAVPEDVNTVLSLNGYGLPEIARELEQADDAERRWEELVAEAREDRKRRRRQRQRAETAALEAAKRARRRVKAGAERGQRG